MQAKCNWSSSSTQCDKIVQLVNDENPPSPNTESLTYEKVDNERCELILSPINNDDENMKIEWSSITIHSSSRIVEIYLDNEKKYLGTVKHKQKVAPGQYICTFSAENEITSSSITLKFLSLDHVTAKQQKNDIHNLIVCGRTITKKKVEQQQNSTLLNELMKNPSIMGIMGMMGQSGTAENKPAMPTLEPLLAQLMNNPQQLPSMLQQMQSIRPSPTDNQQQTPPSNNIVPPVQVIQNQITQQIKQYMHSDEMKQQVFTWVDERMSHWEQRILNTINSNNNNQADPSNNNNNDTEVLVVPSNESQSETTINEDQ
jgi:hypothetical protein